MNILVWGTGKGSCLVIEIAKQLEWNIKAFIDSNVKKQGTMYADKLIIAPDDINKHEYEGGVIVIGTASDEVAECAKRYNRPIISYEKVTKIFLGCSKAPNYTSSQLSNENLKNCHLLPDRLVLLDRVREDFQKEIVFAEIGVAFGDYSKEIVKRSDLRKFYLIDAWEGERYEEGYKAVKEKFATEIKDGIVEILRGYSTEKLKDIEDHSLDVAYIDTVHDYKITWEELMLCKEKVKDTGYIAGHDYVKYNHQSRMDYGVYDAVNHFAVEYGYEFVYITMEKEGLHSFCMRKILK